jgi:hypothetical protein
MSVVSVNLFYFRINLPFSAALMAGDGQGNPKAKKRVTLSIVQATG